MLYSFSNHGMIYTDRILALEHSENNSGNLICFDKLGEFLALLVDFSFYDIYSRRPVVLDLLSDPTPRGCIKPGHGACHAHATLDLACNFRAQYVCKLSWSDSISNSLLMLKVRI